ncbi:hypothetical protein BDP55DRAFT_673074 [Colletotrichum godetiae]|uniref:Secreted protein n=1 Tax=Colletotrichum godetiae TaxID=1209918 RepID=A0AAJ0AEI3_9PEZI|nr:uncharacterized protein BDP55DRAFT_673074 [Colletotrichum godetiae]KAK1672417.1 hypothetical protein BDP55DRAFT_673074 [Colletotrichum godetiae]
MFSYSHVASALAFFCFENTLIQAMDNRCISRSVFAKVQPLTRLLHGLKHAPSTSCFATIWLSRGSPVKPVPNFAAGERS